MASSNVQYPWPSTINVANFISTKLWFYNLSTNYEAWKGQMLCLIESQDLLGFIDGSISPPPETVSTDSSDGSTAMRNQDYALWKRTDRLLKGWILGSLHENMISEVAALNTARDVWLHLENKSRELSNQLQLQLQAASAPAPTATDQQPSSSTNTEQYNRDQHLIKYVQLHQTALRGDWEAARRIFCGDPDATTAKLSYFMATPLQVAVGTGKAIHFVKNLVEMMPDEAIAQSNSAGDTALHIAAAVGNTAAATILVNRMPRLLSISNNNYNDFPVQKAAIFAHKETLQYLISVTKDQTPYEGMTGLRLLLSVIDAEFFDVALYLVEKYPHIARLRTSDRRSALTSMAANKSAFSKGGRFSFWKRFISSICPAETMTLGHQFAASRDTENIVHISEAGPEVIGTMGKQMMNQQARSLVKSLCKQLEFMSFREASDITQDATTTAALFGNHDVVEMIVEAFPNAIYSIVLGANQYIFHVAVQNRSESVYNLIYQMSDHKHLYSDIIDSYGNNLLHVAGKLAPSHKLNEISGAALQMQREMQWYKEVEKFVHPYSIKRLNNEGKSPKMVFTEEHKNLKEKGEEWMKDTSESCTIAAALIATVMFAAAITVPGGNDNNTGFPMFSKDNVFLVFAIADAVSLFTSTTSLLMFLSILTSRYAEEDFLHVLPKRLIFGLATLFLSITFMMVAFSATLYLVFGQKKAWVLIPVAALACLPITSFVLLQFPLLNDLISSTYGPGIFGKQSNRPFY
ncbi:hypothetical protein Pfo_003870 [Paulownia fortunei]|nr:hypothetical protein Pfo_003870 [Paulownia fortunei]